VHTPLGLVSSCSIGVPDRATLEIAMLSSAVEQHTTKRSARQASSGG